MKTNLTGAFVETAFTIVEVEGAVIADKRRGVLDAACAFLGEQVIEGNGIFVVNDLLKIDDYPQLALLAWNRVIREITGEEAFALYERNWRFVDTGCLTPDEAALIERLTAQYGHGVLNV